MNKIYFLPFIIITIILLLGVFYKGNTIENFYSAYNVNNSNTVDLPLNTSYSCSNMCGPLNRCSITGEQCSSDVDCYGCQLTSSTSFINSNNVQPNDESGKLTSSFTPTYSVLTTDIGTKSKTIENNNNNDIPVQYFKGVDMWRDSFDTGMKLFTERNNKNSGNLITFVPKYPETKTLSGDFTVTEPPAANSKL